MNSNRDSLARRIRALRAKTVANGCTEAEAVAAAELLAALLQRYNMTLDEAELREQPFARHTEQHVDLVGARLWKVADAVSKLTGARYWQSRPGVHPIEINFFGLAHEVEVAAYMLEICAAAMRREECRVVGPLMTPRGRRRVAPFLDGMADRLRERILAMVPPVPAGTGLVVLRDALILKAMELEGLRTEQRDARASRDLEPSYFSGRQAGDRVSLNRGLRGDANFSGRLLA